ncbi:MAG TPA: hypothetical protein VGL72_12625, partial [Bryobacteraceae bacterium]
MSSASGFESAPQPTPLPAPAAPPDPGFERLLATVREARPKDDLSGIEKAWQFAASHHAGQKRASGEPYLMHPLAVAQIL